MSRELLLSSLLAIGSAHAGKPLTHWELWDRLQDPKFRAKFNGLPPAEVVFPDEETAAFAADFENKARRT